MGSEGFVGRAGEVARVAALVAGVAGGVGGTLLVVGEQGIGKSALLREGLTGAAGCRVGWGTADELGQRFPLRLIAECLGKEGQLAAEGGSQDSGSVLSLSAPTLGGDPVLAAVERLLVLVDQWCAESPVVMVAEDLQWADDASLHVWQRLRRAAGQLPLLLVGSSRPVSARVERLRQEVAADGGEVLELGPLPGGEAGEMAGEVLGGRPGPRLGGLIQRAGGNPLYVRELCDALVREGRVLVEAGVAELAGGAGTIQVPRSLVAAVGERLEGLPANVAGALRWAAVLGPEFSVTDLGLVTGWPTGKLTEVVEQAVTAGIVVAGPLLGFRHGLIRQVLYEGTPQAVREALHLQAARALAEAGAPAGRVATQLVAGPAGAGKWVQGWLATALPVLAYRAPQVAAELLRRALAEPVDTDERREVLESGLVTVAFLLALDEEVEWVARLLLARTRDPDRAAEAAWLFAYTQLRTSRAGAAVDTVEAAKARPGTSKVWLARLQALQGMILAVWGQPDRAVQLAHEALAGGGRPGDGDQFAAGYALHVLAMVGLMNRDHTGALAHIDQALTTIGDDPRTTDLRVMLLSNRALALEDLDRHAEEGDSIREALALAERAGTARLGPMSVTAAESFFQAGQWDNAYALGESALGLLPGPDYLPTGLRGLLALIAGHRDDRDMAAEHLAAVQDTTFDSPPHRRASYCLLQARALAAERAGRPDEAVAELAQCLGPEFEQDMPHRFMLLPVLTRLALASADTATAAAAVQISQEEAGHNPVPVKTAAAGHCRGLLNGDPVPVLRAADYYKVTGRPFDQAQALEDAAVLLVGRGELAPAQQAFAEGVRLYGVLGAEWDLRRADVRLRQYGIRRGRGSRRARPDQGWQALTPTEVEIAYLVADGRSNPEIAAELFLSRSTVQTHVSHILAKLGVRSRAEVVRHALQSLPSPGRGGPRVPPGSPRQRFGE